MYEMQIASSKRDKIVLSVEAHLNHLDESQAAAHKQGIMEYIGYSRFILTLIDKTGTQIVTPRANIPVADIFYIKEMKDIALNQKTAYDMGGAEPTGETEQLFSGKSIPFGNGRGKTVPEFASTTTREELLDLRSMLERNASKYALNQLLVEDIDTALELIDCGNKESLNTVSKKTIRIYEQKLKYLSSDTDEKGRVFVYSISLTCELEKNMPFCVEITNGYAPLETNSRNLKTPKASAMVNKTSSTMLLTPMEFCGIIDKMYYAARDYDNHIFWEQYQTAKSLSDEAKKAYKEKKEAETA